MNKKIFCKKHKQSLFYIYLNTETGRIDTICQVCEDDMLKSCEPEDTMIEKIEINDIPDRVDIISWKTARRVIENYHYLRYAPAGCKFCLGVYNQALFMGVMIFGHPIARLEEQKNTLELTRMFLFDSPKNSESRALSLAEKWIKANKPEIVRLIAYSDTEQGHNGTIYKAANWKLVGNVRSQSWSNRPHRRGIIGGSKLKYERILNCTGVRTKRAEETVGRLFL